MVNDDLSLQFSKKRSIFVHGYPLAFAAGHPSFINYMHWPSIYAKCLRGLGL